MQNLKDPEAKIICPYNNSHHIRVAKFALHLVKCRKAHGDQKMITCDYNSSHRVPAAELQYHHNTCPNRRTVEVQVNETLSQRETRFPLPNTEVVSEENWDNADYTTYEPKEHIYQRPVLRLNSVEPEAVRKNFKMSERNRFKDLTSNLSNEPPKQQQPLEERAKSTSSKTVKPTAPPSSYRLPGHRSITNLDDNSDIRERLARGANRVYLQYEDKDE